MEKIYADPNMENDNTEHFRGKRLSSILKAPRNPLDDLGNGNELTQDINVEKRRKNSRRVSFANTIKVFQRELKNNTAEGENTGMSTLLHAPIQALVQQTEWHDADSAIQRTNRNDTTLIFSEENEMDMTASHTAVITRNLKTNQADETEKIDVTSFLAGLNSNSGKAEMSKEFHFFSDPTNNSCPSSKQKEDATAVKKINFNEFLMSLKSNTTLLNPTEGPEKENGFFGPLQVSEDVARSSVEFIYSHEPPDTCNVTKIFRGQDDGMEMTKCQASHVKAAPMSAIRGAVSSETVFRGDKTVVFSKGDDMEITGNYTEVFYDDDIRGMNNGHHSDRQEKSHAVQAVNKVLATPVESVVHSEPRKGRCQLPSFSEKSVVFPSGENMDLTGNCVVMAPDYISAVWPERKTLPGYPVQDEKIMPNDVYSLASGKKMLPSREPTPADRTIVFTHEQDDMEITASHTIAVSDNI
ncbi:Protein CASC5, partial [Apaloderma vittatum]